MEKIIKTLIDTENFAKQVARAIAKPCTILLNAEMGMGKTTFTQFLARELCVTEKISSPTYAIVNRYDIIEHNMNFDYKHLYHVDFYRVNSEEELYEIGFEDIFSENSIVVIEWADLYRDYIDELADNVIEITITSSEDSRIFTLNGLDIEV